LTLTSNPGSKPSPLYVWLLGKIVDSNNEKLALKHAIRFATNTLTVSILVFMFFSTLSSNSKLLCDCRRQQASDHTLESPCQCFVLQLFWISRNELSSKHSVIDLTLMSQVTLQIRRASDLLRSIVNNRANVTELRRNAGGWKRRVKEREAKKDIVFQYAGNKVRRSDRIYVWGCSTTGALGVYVHSHCHVVYFWLFLYVFNNFWDNCLCEHLLCSLIII